MARCLHPIRIFHPTLKKFSNDFAAAHGAVLNGEPVVSLLSQKQKDELASKLEKLKETLHIEQFLEIPCGRCLYCYKRKQEDWRIRLQQEQKSNFVSYFVTLTYSPDNEPRDHSVSKKDVQNFLKRFRYYLSGQVRYFCVSEYGPKGTHRPHYHLAMFFPYYISLDEVDFLCRRSWPDNIVNVGELTDGRISYMSTYCIKFFNEAPLGQKPNFMLCSRRPYIGSGYFEDTAHFHRRNLRNYVVVNGFKKKMPRIYKDKIFDDSMKLELRIHMEEYNELNDKKLQALIASYPSLEAYNEAMRWQEKLDYKHAWQKFKESKKF